MDLHLPPPIDDLIPPKTLICTHPVTCTATPRWRTTLVYFLSAKLLQRLRQHHSQVTLEVLSLSLDGSKDGLGQVQLPVSEAKLVLMKHGKPNMAQIKDYVVDKGEWHLLSRGHAQIRAGLFIVEIPHAENGNLENKSIGTPMRKPLKITGSTTSMDRSSSELAFEIRSAGNVSGQLLAATATSPPPSPFPSIASAAIHPGGKRPLQIGRGTSYFTLVFQITGAAYLPSFEAGKEDDIVMAFFDYTFLDKQTVTSVVNRKTWMPLCEEPNYLYLQGDLRDVQDWLRKRGARIRVNFSVEYANRRRKVLAYARVNLGAVNEGIAGSRSFPVYNNKSRRICVSPNNELARITVQCVLLSTLQPGEQRNPTV